MDELRKATGDRKFDVTALLPDTKVVRRGVWGKNREDAERKGRRLNPDAVIIHVQERMNAWA